MGVNTMAIWNFLRRHSRARRGGAGQPDSGVEIRVLPPEERQPALDLALRVFMEFNAPEYTQEGVESFRSTLTDRVYLRMLKTYGAFENGTLAGMLATRDSGSHIALFFVDGRYHRRGIGRCLFEAALRENRRKAMTVNASSYALEFYRRLGFVPADTQQLTDGITYTPMILRPGASGRNGA